MPSVGLIVVRLSKTDVIAGIPAAAARGVARAIGEGAYAERVARLERISIEQARRYCDALLGAGFLSAEPDPDGDLMYSQTLRGSALAMASFLKPMQEDKAQKLLEGVVTRAEAYNEDPEKLLTVDEILIFGSYLDPAATEIGDLDLHVRSSRREADPETFRQLSREYIRRSGRSFHGNWLNEMFWPQTELKQILRNRSPRISLMENEPEELTDRWKLVYRREPRLVDTGMERGDRSGRLEQ